jgi:CRP-like cAMP-binding protein
METDAGKTINVLEKVIFLKRSHLFSTMKTSDLRAVAAIAEDVEFLPEQEIVRENDVGDSMYIIREGTVRIVKSAGSSRFVLASIGPGECFGEMAIFDAEVRSASVIAAENCRMLRLDSNLLKDVLFEYPAIAFEFLKIFVKRLRNANSTIQTLSAPEGQGSKAK